ncbi:efflux RND transporter periplasmic adaptor subunit [Shewanella sp. KX20019]|uniref:efflux RND transporter periplasmic adaptor subunit n=1 Tax=Shewanella sp. KX20019 TaxID=2803864 RepID=UPI00192542CF|nr:efflux RND transporter periplasmic adaptor subunit [Shewanella sp. KX20019]QQX80600.1 efflux RND transporter periplasmic adaptor subunit [Shewanella sp. KX20019]
MSLFKSTQFRKNVVCALSSLVIAATPMFSYSQALAQTPSAAHSQQHSADYYCPMHPEETSHEPGRCSICKMFLVKDEVSNESAKTDELASVSQDYYCPMHPEETSHEPGSCSICKMFLVKDEVSNESEKTDELASVSKDYYCPMHPEVTSHEPGRCPKCNMFLVKEEEEETVPDEHASHDHANKMDMSSEPQTKAEQLLSQPKPMLMPAAQSSGDSNIKYVCPMHPHVVSDAPGTCPICGMNLEKVTVGGVSEEVVVGVSGGMQQALGMRSEQVTKGTLSKQVKTIGTVQYNENAIGHAHTRVSGWLETLMVHTVGQQVKKGQLLYELYSPELINAQDDYMQAIDYLKQDSRRGNDLLRKARLRLELLGVSSSTIKHLERTGETVYRVPYYAEQDGFVSQLSVRHGMYVQPGNTLFEIVDLSNVWVIADVFENEQSWLEQGRPVEVTSASQGLFDLQSTIDYIYPELDPVSRAMRVRIKLANTEKLLKPGTLVDVTLFGEPKKNVLSIPTEALILTGRENRVVVQRDDNRFASVSVKVGIISQGKAEIIEGLNAGDKVIVSGQFLLDSEASIQGSLQRLSGSNSSVTADPHANH